MIRIDDEQYWLYAAIESNSNGLLPKWLQATRTDTISDAFFAELRESHDVDDAVFLVNGATPLKDARSFTVSISDTKIMEIGVVSNVYF